MTSISVGNKKIGKDEEPFIIAEMSGNHNGSKERAIEIIKSAAATGVDCLKFQTYTADTITLDCQKPDFMINDPKSLWNGRQLHGLYDEAHTPWEWHEELFRTANEHGVIAFSSPFDETAVDFLDELGVPMFKVASFEITHLPLIRKIGKTGKPVIISTGMASIEEIETAILTARDAGTNDIIILKCTSQYPANASDANLQTIADMSERFGVQAGLSDHTLGIGVGVAAIGYGATVIEKHFTIDRSQGGVDSEFSMEPHEMKMLKEETSRAWHARGKIKYDGTENEKNSKQFRQSIYPSTNISAGDVFSKRNLKICRPGLSLEPSHWNDLLGKQAKRDIEMGERLKPEDI